MKTGFLVLVVGALSPVAAFAQTAPVESPAPADTGPEEAQGAAVPADPSPPPQEPAQPDVTQSDAEAQDDYASAATIPDPFEPFNRAVFGFNNVADRYVIEPTARGYRAVTPRFVRTGVNNFLANLGEPITFANEVLQGQPKRAGATLGRFVVNTTIGVAGVMNPAQSMGLERREEDFGQTLGAWGVGSGPYLVLPLLGPSSLRDTTGLVVDRAFTPDTYFDGEDAPEYRIGVNVVGAIATREALLETVENVRNSSADPYVTFRSLYGQARASAIRNGREDVEALPDFDGDPLPDEGAAPEEPAAGYEG